MSRAAVIEACFLDIDGVLHDLDLLSDQWSALLGTELARLLGGDAEAWARANQETFADVWSRRAEWRTTPLEYWQDEAVTQLSAMCLALGLKPPPIAEAIEVMRECEVRILRRGTAIFPGVKKTILELCRDYTLHMATGNLTWRIEAMLQAMGIDNAIGLKSGPDLVGARKDTVLFYERLFELAGVPASRALVIDDTALQIALATTVGARTVHVSSSCDHACSADAHIQSFAEVPKVARRLR